MWFKERIFTYLGQAQWRMPIISTAQEAEMERIIV
jgi:hypothetical protein